MGTLNCCNRDLKTYFNFCSEVLNKCLNWSHILIFLQPVSAGGRCAAPQDWKSPGGFAPVPGEPQPCGPWQPLCLNKTPLSCNQSSALHFWHISAWKAHGEGRRKGGTKNSRESIFLWHWLSTTSHPKTKALDFLGTQKPWTALACTSVTCSKLNGLQVLVLAAALSVNHGLHLQPKDATGVENISESSED